MNAAREEPSLLYAIMICSVLGKYSAHIQLVTLIAAPMGHCQRHCLHARADVA